MEKFSSIIVHQMPEKGMKAFEHECLNRIRYRKEATDICLQISYFVYLE